jgi:chemosensory pili system protein ChpC
MSEQLEIRTLIAPISGGGVLLPGSMIAEVVNYSEPEPYDEGPDWLLGELRWSGWQIPVVNMAMLAETTDDPLIPERSRVLVVKTLSDSASIMHIGVVINGLPRMKTVTTGNLEEKETGNGPGIFSRISLDGQDAFIPDLDELAVTIERAVYTR